MEEKNIIPNSILIDENVDLSLPVPSGSQEISSDSLGRRQKSIQIHENSEQYLATTREDIPKDYTTARNTINNLIDTGMMAVKDCLEFAQESGHPRAFEVLGNLMKTVGEQSERLLNIHKTVQELRNNENSSNDQLINVTIDQRTGPNLAVSARVQDVIAAIKKEK